jgi:hypothetical protein
MTDRGLPKMYDKLTVWERLPLLIAADDRGDDVEWRRLFGTSPIKSWKFSEHLMAEEALNTLALCHVIDQLEAAAIYFYALFQRFGEAPNRERDWALEADLHAFNFQTNAQAWKLLCGEAGIDPEALVRVNFKGWFLKYCEIHMPANVPAEEDLRTRMRQAGLDDKDLKSAETLAKLLRDLLEKMTRSTPPRWGDYG